MTATEANEAAAGHARGEAPAAAPAGAEPQPAPGATSPRTPSLLARAAAELVGTAALVTVVVGSGIQATDLTEDVGLQLLANSTATVFGLGVLILLLGPVSGAHFNPAVTLAEWWTARRGERVSPHVRWRSTSPRRPSVRSWARSWRTRCSVNRW